MKQSSGKGENGARERCGETASARWRFSEGSPRDLECTREETSHAQAQERTPRKQQVGAHSWPEALCAPITQSGEI